MGEAQQIADRDAEHLRLLSIFYYVLAAFNALASCFCLIFLLVGVVLIVVGAQSSDAAVAVVFGGFFVGMAAFALAIGVGVAALLYYTGRFLGERSHYTYCFVIAVLCCLSVPLGTVLGVFTLVVLSRPTVKALFGARGSTAG